MQYERKDACVGKRRSASAESMQVLSLVDTHGGDHLGFLCCVTCTFVWQSLRAGTVWVNDYNVFCNQVPFGGFKQSGLGRENGPYGIKNYIENKSVLVKLTAKNS